MNLSLTEISHLSLKTGNSLLSECHELLKWLQYFFNDSQFPYKLNTIESRNLEISPQ